MLLNVGESDLPGSGDLVGRITRTTRISERSDALSAKIEMELGELDPEMAACSWRAGHPRIDLAA